MKATLCDNLSGHFALLGAECNPNNMISVLGAIILGDSSDEWKRLKKSAYLVASEVTHYHPDWKKFASIEAEDLVVFMRHVYSGEKKGVLKHRFFFEEEYRNGMIENKLILSKKGRCTLSLERAIELANEFLSYIQPGASKGKSPDETGLFLCPDPILNRHYLNSQESVTPENILAILAVSGIEVALPSIYCEEADDLEKVREMFAEERQNYLGELSEMIRECHEGIRSGLYDDAWEFARVVTNTKIKEQARQFEKSVKMADKALLKRIEVGIVHGVPAIFESLLDPTKSVFVTAGAEILKVFCTALTEKSNIKIAQERYPLASYAYRIKSVVDGG